MLEEEDLRARIKALVQTQGSLVVLTGAGMSAESGIPTFRDAQTGYWSRFDPMQLASEEGFRDNPARVWDWYAERRAGVRLAEPNAGHRALAAFARRHPGVLSIVTQNVDDLHQRAGSPDVIRLHGDILLDRWLEPCARRRRSCDPGMAPSGRPPRCSECGNPVRPGVVWFGEALPAAALDEAERAVQRCELLIVVGTSGSVWPAAGLVGQARSGGATVVLVNPNDSEVDHWAHHRLRGTAAEVLPALFEDAGRP